MNQLLRLVLSQADPYGKLPGIINAFYQQGGTDFTPLLVMCDAIDEASLFNEKTFEITAAIRRECHL